MTEKQYHILGLSGGKDSAALAVYMQTHHPGLIDYYFFCDTKKELPETEEFLDKLSARLDIKIHYLHPERGFDHWLDVYNGYLPSPRARWCTKQMKIQPLEEFIDKIEADNGPGTFYSYIGIRADEDRDGYLSTRPNIKPVFPFKEAGITREDVFKLLEDHGIGLPKYYEWRSRSGCHFCFFQRKYEWVKLAERHPDLFEEAKKYEHEHADGRKYTWSDDETLDEIIARKDQIIAEHEASMERKKKQKPNQSLAQSLEDVLDEEDEELSCLVCHI
jgi:3'-phosphoadenosine 5'-phosphosulfate sulfotransferase (PAPS reductase)/FAD synthetase